jgi:hypothetical protein
MLLLRAIFGYQSTSNQTMILRKIGNENETKLIESVEIHEGLAETGYTFLESGTYR